MKVYVVTAGDFYESDSVCCLFMHKADADAYAAQLKGSLTGQRSICRLSTRVRWSPPDPVEFSQFTRQPDDRHPPDRHRPHCPHLLEG